MQQRTCCGLQRSFCRVTNQSSANVSAASFRAQKARQQLGYASASMPKDDAQRPSTPSSAPTADHPLQKVIPTAQSTTHLLNPYSYNASLEKAEEPVTHLLTWKERAQLQFLHATLPPWKYEQLYAAADPRANPSLPFAYSCGLWLLGSCSLWLCLYWNWCGYRRIASLCEVDASESPRQEVRESLADKDSVAGNSDGRQLDSRNLVTILCSRLCGHLGPYFLPVLLKDLEMHKRSLQTLADRHTDPMETYGALLFLAEAMQRSTTANYVLRGGSSPSEYQQASVVASGCNGLNSPVPTGSWSEPEAHCRPGLCRLAVVFERWFERRREDTNVTEFGLFCSLVINAVCRSLPQDRELAYKQLQGLTSRNSKFWAMDPRDEEIKAVILLKLLQNRANALKVYDEEAHVLRTELQRSATGEQEKEKHQLAIVSSGSDSTDTNYPHHGQASQHALASAHNDTSREEPATHNELEGFMSSDATDEAVDPDDDRWRSQSIRDSVGRAYSAVFAWLNTPVFPSPQEAWDDRQAKLKAAGLLNSAEPRDATSCAQVPSTTPSSSPSSSSASSGPQQSAQKDAVEDDMLVLEYLYGPGDLDINRFFSLLPAARLFLSSECHDIKRRAIQLINKYVRQRRAMLSGTAPAAGASDVECWELALPAKEPRQSLLLQTKIDGRYFGGSAFVAVAYAAAMLWRHRAGRAAASGLQSASPILRTFGRSLRGFAILEALYRLQEHYLIDTPKYFDDTQFMLRASGAMAVANALIYAAVLRTHRYVLVPFLYNRFSRDITLDSFVEFF